MNIDTPNLPIASLGKRLINFVIDVSVVLLVTVLPLAFYFIISAGAIMGVIISPIGLIFSFIAILIPLGMYYTIAEYFFAGKTIGKLVTKTRAVTMDGGRMGLSTVVKRSLCRLVPFEQFSFIGSEPILGWHDTWSKSKVVDEIKTIQRHQ